MFTTKADTASSVEDEQLMEKVLDRENHLMDLRNVERKWPKIREQLLSGTYAQQSVRRLEIPNPGSGIRQLGITTVLDRFIQQALFLVLQQDWDATLPF